MKNPQLFGTAMPDYDAISKTRRQKLILMVFAFCLFSATVFGQTAPSLSVSDLTSYNNTGGSPVAIAPTLTIADPDLVGMSAAMITIDSNFVAGQDYLTFDSMSGITSTFDVGKGILRLSGTASATTYQAALRAVTFSTTSANTNRRRFSITLGDAYYNAANGHFYKAATASGLTTFTDVVNAAQASSLFGWQGYIVTITSSQENQYVANICNTSLIGASDNAVEGVWRWKTGPEGLEDGGQGRYFSTQFLTGGCRANTGTGVSGYYVSWNNREPNNCGGNEDYAMLSNGTGWNDITTPGGNNYVIEYGGFTGETPLSINGSAYADVVPAPLTITDIPISDTAIMENNSVGSMVGTFSTTSSDIRPTSFTYALVSGAGSADNAAFTIVGSDLIAAQVFSYPSQQQFHIRVATTDTFGNTFEKAVTITINPILPTVSDFTVTVTPSQTYYFSRSKFDANFSDFHNAGISYITILSLPSEGELDQYGTPVSVGDNIGYWDLPYLTYNAVGVDTGSYVANWMAMGNNGLATSDTAHIVFHAINANAPTDILISSSSVMEMTPNGTLVGNLTGVDVDSAETFTYELVSGDQDWGNYNFIIVGNQLQVNNMMYSWDGPQSIRVAVTDHMGLTYIKIFSIDITPFIESVSNFSVSTPQNIQYGFTEMQFYNTTLGAQSMGLNFIQIQSLPTNGVLNLYGSPVNVGDQVYDWDLDNLSYVPNNGFGGSDAFQWMAEDNWGYDSQNSAIVTINVIAPNHAPTDINFTTTDIDELQPIGTAVGTMSSVDADAGDTFTYTFVPGAGDTDNASFTIFLNKLQAAESFDYAVKSTYHVRVATTDSSGASYEKAITVNVRHLLPVLTTISDNVIQGDTLAYAATEFANNYTVADRLPMTDVIVTSLPSFGVLYLNGVAVNIGDIITSSDLDHLAYASDINFDGDDSFTWNVHDGLGFRSGSDGESDIHVAKKRVITGTSDIHQANAGSPGGSGDDGSGRSLIPELILTNPGATTSGTCITRSGGPIDPNSLGGGHKTDGSETGVQQTTELTVTNKCFPNPFSQNITIQYQLPADAKVELKVYNLLGMEVANLVDANQTAGAYQIDWNGNSSAGLPIDKGNYFYKITLLDNAGNIVGTVNGHMIKL